MKFELFGRLRDNSDGSDQQQQDFGSPSGNGTQDMQMGDGLDRTVESMFEQGYSEEEIKQELSGQYERREIEDAINNAVASNVQGESLSGGPEPMTPYQGEGDGAKSPMDEGYGNETQQQPEPEPQQPQPIQSPGNEQQKEQGSGGMDPRTEELVETIVAEKMDQLFDEFENVYEELDSLREEVEEMDQRVHDLEVRDDEDQQQFVQKVDEMEDHIDSYQSRIGGLEKAFQQVLPSLVDNVQDLTALVQEIKKERGIETENAVPSEELENVDMEDWD